MPCVPSDQSYGSAHGSKLVRSEMLLVSDDYRDVDALALEALELARGDGREAVIAEGAGV